MSSPLENNFLKLVYGHPAFNNNKKYLIIIIIIKCLPDVFLGFCWCLHVDVIVNYSNVTLYCPVDNIARV